MHECTCLEELSALRDELSRLLECRRHGWPTEDVVKAKLPPRGDDRYAEDRRLWAQFLERRKAWGE